MQQESASTPTDPYWKLRPNPATPDEEVCHCNPCQELMLRDSLGGNPLYCVGCNGEVAPERIGFDERLAEDIAGWRSIYRSLYLLWLDSGEYEVWAREKLRDPIGSVNVRGREIVQQLNKIVRTYYWWFSDDADYDVQLNDDANYDAQPKQCPSCSAFLEKVPGREFYKCDKCLILI